MQLVDLDQTTLAVHEWGSPDDPALFFWHALGPDASAEYFAPVAERLAAAGYRVVAVDGPGFGASPVLEEEGYALDSLVELLQGLVVRLDLEPLVVMGHSWGGAIAVRYAAAHPENVTALVLLDSGHIDYGDLPEVDADRPAADWVEEVRARDGRHSEARGRAMHGLTAPVSDAWPVIAEQRIPTLLILATLPPHVEQNREHIGRFEQALPHAEVRWAENAGHGLVDDIGPSLGDEIAGWLADQDR
ncbi:MAG TPA: alpha/beta fold hydrolase [Gaiellaceae bacterium]|nr:alpha/beta fold hydrolase [Gaiellaceae bacterium]